MKEARLIDANELRKNMEKHCEWCKRCLSLYADLKGRCELCPMSQVFSWIDPEAGIKEYVEDRVGFAFDFVEDMDIDFFKVHFTKTNKTVIYEKLVSFTLRGDKHDQ